MPASVETVHSELLSHLVEASSMKVEIDHIKNNQTELTHRLLVSMGELSVEIKAMRSEIQSVPDRIQTCRTDMRREIEKDFPDRVDAVDKAFPAGLQRDLIRQLAVVAWAGAVERDRNDD